MSKVGISNSPAAYVSAISKALHKPAAGKTEKSDKQKNGVRSVAGNAGEQVSLVSPLRSAHQKKEKLRVFSKVRLALDKDISKAGKHARTPTADLEKLVPVNGLKNARNKPVPSNRKSAWGKFKNFLRKSESPTSESSGLASKSSPQSTPLKKVKFEKNTEISYVIGTPPATGRVEYQQSKVTKTVNVSEIFDISALRKTDDINSYLDAGEERSSGDKNPVKDGRDESRLRPEQEEEELDQILAKYKSGAPTMHKSGSLQEDLKAPAKEREGYLEKGKKLAAESARQDSDGRKFRRMHEELKALGKEIERDLERWESESSGLRAEKSVETSKGAADDVRLQAEQKIARDLRIARNYEEIDRLIAEADENLRIDIAQQNVNSKPGSGGK